MESDGCFASNQSLLCVFTLSICLYDVGADERRDNQGLPFDEATDGKQKNSSTQISALQMKKHCRNTRWPSWLNSVALAYLDIYFAPFLIAGPRWASSPYAIKPDVRGYDQAQCKWRELVGDRLRHTRKPDRGEFFLFARL
jgi:hypothetical protein